MKKNISNVYKDHLCSGCTICGELCPHKSIEFTIDNFGFYKPIVNNDCTNCGICLNNCPGANDLKNYSHRDEYYCYGFSNNKEHRKNCSSGGIATELLCYLVANKIVDYVTVVTNRSNLSNPRQILTNDINTIIECRGSKYCPVSWDGILDEVIKVNGRVAICGLPCQINALKSYFKKKRNKPNLLYISLFCNHTPSLNAANYLVSAAGNNERLHSIINRSNGFPGYMMFSSKDKNGKIKNYRSPFRKTMAAGYGSYFKNIRCYLCNDPFGKNADISMADSYFLQETDTEGTTFCIVRNKEIQNILKEMHLGGVISIKEGPSKDIQERYYKVLYDREKLFLRNNNIMQLVYRKSVKTEHEEKNVDFSIRNIIGFIIKTNLIRLGRYRWLWPFLIRKNKLKALIEKIS